VLGTCLQRQVSACVVTQTGKLATAILEQTGINLLGNVVKPPFLTKLLYLCRQIFSTIYQRTSLCSL
jgi:hypothetical protein